MSIPLDVINPKVTETNNIDPTNYDLENPTSEMNGRKYKIILTSFAESDEDAAETYETFSKCSAAYAGIGIGLFVIGCYYTVTCKDSSSDECDEVSKNAYKIAMFVGAPLVAIACCCCRVALRAFSDIRN